MSDIRILNAPGFESQTESYDSTQFDSISFNLPNIGDPLREEKSTVTISCFISAEDRPQNEDEDEPLFGSHLKEAKRAIKSIFDKD
jgi:hypothetical protein